MNILHVRIAAGRRGAAAAVNIYLCGDRQPGRRPRRAPEAIDEYLSIFSYFLVKNNKIMKLICNGRARPHCAPSSPAPRASSPPGVGPFDDSKLG